MTIPIRRPPPKKQVQEQTIMVKWIRLPLSTNSIFTKLPQLTIEIEDNELISYEKKAVQPKPKTETTFLLEIKKYNAINIAFSRINNTDEEIINEVMLNNSVNDNLIRVLYQYFPSEEEFMLIEEKINLLDTVSKQEECRKEVIKSNFELKKEINQLIYKFNEIYEEAHEFIDNLEEKVKKSNEEIKDFCEKLKIPPEKSKILLSRMSKNFNYPNVENLSEKLMQNS
ncbi:hypothetical protein TUBRATIS_24400 [Tubulinosema ratisbonensis]|uniref:Uncharacterized protein n=1 Tax=Tubulinosema ratisbonensis TaxID=291195 RepID=A0A437AJ45_9MICR|nr:hypothetical protein TUBRATIS_24400 [Tubulinosema ratisbonensis]